MRWGTGSMQTRDLPLNIKEQVVSATQQHKKQNMEWGTKKKIIDEIKKLLDDAY